MGKKSKISSSTKWGLGESVVLWVKECLTPTVSFDIFMDNYFRYFCMLTLLGVNKIQATCVVNKSSLRKCTHHYGQAAAEERKVAILNSTHQAKKKKKKGVRVVG